MSRKIHNDELGYIAERKNPFSTGKVVIYVAEQQGIDSGAKYAVVCDAHKTIAGATSIPAARIIMKSVEFCEVCMEAAATIA
jgi:hypothetical protein